MMQQQQQQQQMGPDGNPLPVWLYKLRGLHKHYGCEICGNATYQGRREFDRHFTEALHVKGLACLGIRYSRDYYHITRIQDAKALQATLS